ncbi:ras association domain-containing protein 8-like isoform X2 [Scleropages formosus]|uniref:Ras association domain family member 8 n=1 Tax=Scleropages formosus TaxID=113540 RepID=A0A8D0CF70_SCLFO|nr:ras association domain-containing protein 8-like [Scleropages formosus]XP_029105670.1 ras association domain-containing protein 8-like isoform X2 [Scleropages formosus]
MKGHSMELKVWVDGVQRVVCGVTEATTCQEVVIALAQAIGRTGRYTLTEKWQGTERPLAPFESPVISLNRWGQHAGDVQLILHHTGSSPSERLVSDGRVRIPERTLYRQSLPPLAKLHPLGDRSLRRKEPKRKSLTLTGGAKSFLDIFGRPRELEAKHRALHHSNSIAAVPGVRAGPAGELAHLVQLQKEKLQLLERRIGGCETELRAWAARGAGVTTGVGGAVRLQEEIRILEQKVRRNDAEIDEEEFWENELQIEQENERQLKEQLQDLLRRIYDCEAKLSGYFTHIQSMEAGMEVERMQQETQEVQRVKEEEVHARVLKLKTELDAQTQQSARLECSCRAVERSLGHSSRRLQEKEEELEQLTKELRQVNLQQFIQQTGTKVTVLPTEETSIHVQLDTDVAPQSGSLKCPATSRQLPGNLRHPQSPPLLGFNPEGIYV